MHDQPSASVVLPHLALVEVQQIESQADEVRIVACAVSADARCPSCGTPSASVRGRYRRHLADLPIGGMPVHLDLQVRRFNCVADSCPARTFVEQIPGLTSRRARRSQSLQQLLHGVGAALAGRAGARLCAKLAMDTSRTTLLRLLRAAPEPQLTAAPRVLGVDLSRGWGYPDGASPRRSGHPMVSG